MAKRHAKLTIFASPNIIVPSICSGECLNGIQKVIGSIPTVSTTQKARKINGFPSFLSYMGMSIGFWYDPYDWGHQTSSVSTSFGSIRFPLPFHHMMLIISLFTFSPSMPYIQSYPEGGCCLEDHQLETIEARRLLPLVMTEYQTNRGRYS